MQRLQYARSKEARDRAREREAPPAAPEPLQRGAHLPRPEFLPMSVASVTAMPRVQAAIARLHPPVVSVVPEPDVRRRLSCKRKVQEPVPVSAPLRRRIVGKQSLEITRQTQQATFREQIQQRRSQQSQIAAEATAAPRRQNRQTSSLFTVPRAVISQLARQRESQTAAVQDALQETSTASDATLQHISSIRTARAKRTDGRGGERKRAYRSFYPSGGWNSAIGQQTLRQSLQDHPIPEEKVSTSMSWEMCALFLLPSLS